MRGEGLKKATLFVYTCVRLYIFMFIHVYTCIHVYIKDPAVLGAAASD